MKMLNPTSISEVEASVLGQCLKFTSKIAKNNKSFTLNLKLSNGFIFNFFNNEKRNSLLENNMKKRKPSPSTLARNKIRMEKFIAMKKASAPNTNTETGREPSTGKDTSNVTLKDSEATATITYKCDHCDYENNTKKGLSCHIEQKHKEKQGVQSPIIQLDGASDDIEEPIKEDPKCQLVKGDYLCSEVKLKFEGSTAYGIRPIQDHTVCLEVDKKA